MSTAGMGPPPVGLGAPPPNYLVQAILTTIFCCLPFGIVAIVFASQVNSKFAARDFAGAKASSDSARKWSWVSFGLGLVVIVISIVVQILAFGAAVANQGEMAQ